MTRNIARVGQSALVIAGFFASLIAPAGATTVIATLGEAPLVGPLPSTHALVMAVFRNPDRFHKAARLLGLSSDQYEELTEDISDRENVRWVTIPRHLDAMSWASSGRVHVIKDVLIPPKTAGWAIHLSGGIVAYVPARCGNLSVLHEAQPRRVAAAPKPVIAPLAATAPAPDETVAAADAPAPPEAPPPPPEAPPPAAVAVAPLAAVPIAAPAAHSLWAAIGAALLPLIGLGGGSSGGSAAAAGCP